jgi:hypothetical protein
MQVTVTGTEYAVQVTSAWLEVLEPVVDIDIQKEEIIPNDVIVYTKRTFPIGSSKLTLSIIERGKPPNLQLTFINVRPKHWLRMINL